MVLYFHVQQPWIKSKTMIKVLETGLKSPEMYIDSALVPSQPLKCTDLSSRGLRIVKTFFHSGSSYFRKDCSWGTSFRGVQINLYHCSNASIQPGPSFWSLVAISDGVERQKCTSVSTAFVLHFDTGTITSFENEFPGSSVATTELPPPNLSLVPRPFAVADSEI